MERLYSLVIGQGGTSAMVRRLHLLYGNSELLARSADLESVLQSFESSVHLHVAEMAPHKVFVHAGVVGWKEKAIVIPGRSFSGKSTLVAEFVRAGAKYYSDEYAVLDVQGNVHPYSRPVVMRENGARKKYTAEELGGIAGVNLVIRLAEVSADTERGEPEAHRLTEMARRRAAVVAESSSAFEGGEALQHARSIARIALSDPVPAVPPQERAMSGARGSRLHLEPPAEAGG